MLQTRCKYIYAKQLRKVNLKVMGLMQISPKREQASTMSKFSASVFEDKRLERTDFAVVQSGQGQV